MASARERLEINRYLGKHGLATLDDPAGLVQQLAFCVRDHIHFRQILVRCEPEHRHALYEAFRPHLSFEAKPLDVYVAEAGADAEARQLPTVGPDGQLQPFRVPEVTTDVDHAQGAVDRALAKQPRYQFPQPS